MNFTESFDFNKPISLYIHIPFCHSKCSYCAFYSKTCFNENEKEAYTNKLVKEIEAVTSLMDKPFYTAYIGGGNPFCLSFSQLERICKAVCKNGNPVEFTSEINPESASNEYSGLFEKYLTRLSMGVQSVDEKALNFLGRNADSEQTLKGIYWAKGLEKKGIDISFDLITCLGEFHNHMKDVSFLVENFQPVHLSVYSLTLEENTALYNRKPQLPSPDDQFDVLNEIWKYLENKGYSHYEVSNFAVPGKESLHNLVYWDYQQYIGLGAAAASTAVNNGIYTRFNCVSDYVQYLKSPLFSSYSKEVLTPTEALEEFILMGVRHKKGISLKRLKDEFDREIAFEVPGFEISDVNLIPSDNGMMTADAAAFLILDSLS